MATICGGMARGKRLRLTRLDECGEPVEGTCSTLVTEGFILVTDTANYQDPEDITQANADGALCVDDQSDPALRWMDLEIQLCTIDPDAITMMTGDPTVLDDAVAPNTVGYRIDSALTGTGNFALEVWSGVPGQACTAGGFPLFGYHLFPWVKQATFQERTVQNGVYTVTLNARTQAGSTWGVGPYNIRRDATVPATLEPLITPIGATQHYHFQWSDAPLPTAACGCTELVIP
jgi:hypothetical protein